MALIEKAQQLITYSNFWKQFYRKFPQYRQSQVTARDFEPGEGVEVDYAGDVIEWFEIKTGETHKAYVFVSGLGFSQLLFAWAAEDMKSRNWLGAHRPCSPSTAACRTELENKISKNSVHRYFLRFGVKPHLSKSFKLSTDSFFVEKLRELFGF